MISFRIQTLAAAVAGAASLLAGAAHAGGHPCTSAADCGGSYRPASAAYALTPPGPAYANAGYAQQSAYPPGYVGYDRASLGPAYDGGGYGPPAPPAGYAPSPCASPACAAPPPPPAPDCATYCVPAYRVVQVAPPVETVQLASDVYTGGVGVTEVYGGGGGGYTNGNFEVNGFGDVSSFAASHAAAQADAVSYARSLSYAKASAQANADAYSKAYANSSAYANATTNVNIKLNASFNGKVVNHGGWNKGGKGGNDCNCQPKPQPVTCNTCGGSGGVGYGGGMGGSGKGGSWGMAPSPRGGGSWGGGKHH